MTAVFDDVTTPLDDTTPGNGARKAGRPSVLVTVTTVLLLVASALLVVGQRSAAVEGSVDAAAAATSAQHEAEIAEAAAAAASAVGFRVEEIADEIRTTEHGTSETLTRLGELHAELDALAIEITGVEQEIDDLDRTSAGQLITFVGLQVCLDGIRKATLAGGGSEGVSQLQQVEDYCRATMTSLGVNGRSGFAFDFADPFVLQHDGTYYAFATNAGAGAVQLISSADLIDWTLIGEALGAVPAWAELGQTWAPSVAKVGDRWVLYYTVRERRSGLQCISSATATAPTGPFVDDSSGPLVCQQDLGGSIDPSPYVDEKGVVFLLWKSDEIVRGRSARIWVAPLDDTGRKLGWFPIELGRADRGWENRVMEGPAMVKEGDRYYVLYSGNHWGTVDYATGYLECDAPLGPCRKPPDNVILASHGSENGPGGAEVFLADGLRRVVYHAWEGDDIGYPNKRRVHTAPLSFTHGRPTIG